MKKNLFLLVVFLSVVFVTNTKNYERPLVEPKIYPLENQSRFHLGFRTFLADIYWLRVIQNMDYCENDGERTYNPGLGVEEILDTTLKPSRCDRGWVYQMINLITELAPKFRKVYRLGGEMLSVAVDDREGARLIFDKGAMAFPGYWELLYSSSYHYLFEFQQPEKAADLLMQAADAGGPFWFRQMAGTLYSRAGKLMMAEITLKAYIDNFEGKRGVEQAKMRLKEVEKMKQDLINKHKKTQ